MCMISAGCSSRSGVAVNLIVGILAGMAFLPAFGQDQTVQKSDALEKLPLAMTETECVGDRCALDGQVSGTWKFRGVVGTADWNNDAEATVVIERFDEKGVEIRRIDLPNSSSYGLTAVYKGELKGKRMEGTVVWSWNGHWSDDHPTGRWSAEIHGVAPAPPPTIAIPPSIIECEADQCAPGRQGGCRWTFHGREGESHCRNGADFKLEVLKFDAKGIVLRRTDLPGSTSAGLTALYTGTLNGKRITGIGTTTTLPANGLQPWMTPAAQPFLLFRSHSSRRTCMPTAASLSAPFAPPLWRCSCRSTARSRTLCRRTKSAFGA
jgi:uncharacterized protein YbbK (DUF523 family)